MYISKSEPRQEAVAAAPSRCAGGSCCTLLLHVKHCGLPPSLVALLGAQTPLKVTSRAPQQTATYLSPSSKPMRPCEAQTAVFATGAVVLMYATLSARQQVGVNISSDARKITADYHVSGWPVCARGQPRLGPAASSTARGCSPSRARMCRAGPRARLRGAGPTGKGARAPGAAGHVRCIGSSCRGAGGLAQPPHTTPTCPPRSSSEVGMS